MQWQILGRCDNRESQTLPIRRSPYLLVVGILLVLFALDQELTRGVVLGVCIREYLFFGDATVSRYGVEYWRCRVDPGPEDTVMPELLRFRCGFEGIRNLVLLL